MLCTLYDSLVEIHSGSKMITFRRVQQTNNSGLLWLRYKSAELESWTHDPGGDAPGPS